MSRCLFFHLVLPHAAPATRDRRRWFDGPADVTRAADQLAGILMFRVLVCWSRFGWKSCGASGGSLCLESLAGAEDGARQAGATSLPLNGARDEYLHFSFHYGQYVAYAQRG